MAASLASKPAVAVAHYASYGEQLLREEGVLQQVNSPDRTRCLAQALHMAFGNAQVHRTPCPQDDARPQTKLFGGSSRVLGEEAFDEEICVSGRRYAGYVMGCMRTLIA